MKKLFVGSLSWGTTESELESAFARFGEIAETKIITDRQTGRSRGFGFVTFAEDQAADAAMEEMNGFSLGGRTITVNEAHDRKRDNRGDGFSGRRRERR